MSKLLVTGLLLTAIAVGAEQVMAKRNGASTPTIAPSSTKEQVSVVQRGFKKIEFGVLADSLVSDTTVRFERR